MPGSASAHPWQTRSVSELQDWTIVIPVKGTAASKSRFGPGDHRDLALAMALDTVEAAIAVGRVIVVTVGGAEFQSRGAIVVQDPGDGLVAAITAALAHAEGNTAVVLGDHPALTPTELREVLMLAHEHPLAMVADDDGTGTALVSALDGHAHHLAFGPSSRERHSAAGYVELEGDWPGLRRDVDLIDHLDGIVLGRHSREILGR